MRAFRPPVQRLGFCAPLSLRHTSAAYPDQGYTRREREHGIVREFVFTVEYESGADEVMDLFIEHPDLRARSMEVHATSESVWGIDKVVGPSDALEEFDERLERVTSDPDATGMCGAPVTE